MRECEHKWVNFRAYSRWDRKHHKQIWDEYETCSECGVKKHTTEQGEEIIPGDEQPTEG